MVREEDPDPKGNGEGAEKREWLVDEKAVAQGTFAGELEERVKAVG